MTLTRSERRWQSGSLESTLTRLSVFDDPHHGVPNGLPQPGDTPSLVYERTSLRKVDSAAGPGSYLVRNIPYTRTRARVLVSC